MGLPDSACAHFKRLAAYHDSLRPKALYSASYIYRSGIKDTVRSDSLYRVLLKEFPSNLYTQKAQIDRGIAVTVRTRADSAQDAYMAAESLFCFVKKPEDAATAFLNVHDAYPDCESGIKALYASAWINDQVLANNKTAYKLYRTLCDSFPQCSIYVDAAKPRLKTVSDTLAARKARGGKIKPQPLSRPVAATPQMKSLTSAPPRLTPPPLTAPVQAAAHAAPAAAVVQPAKLVKGAIAPDTSSKQNTPISSKSPTQISTPAPSSVAPMAPKVPAAPPPTIAAPKAPQNPKPEIKTEDTESVDTVDETDKTKQ